MYRIHTSIDELNVTCERVYRKGGDAIMNVRGRKYQVIDIYMTRLSDEQV